MSQSFSVHRVIRGASPSDPASLRRASRMLREGKAAELLAERDRKIRESGEKPQGPRSGS